MRVAQELDGPLHFSLGHKGSNVGGGDGNAVLLHLLNDIAAYAQRRALGPQPLWVALAHVAKVKIVAGHNMNYAQLIH